MTTKLIETEAEFEALKERLWAFMHEHIYPNEQRFARENHEVHGVLCNFGISKAKISSFCAVRSASTATNGRMRRF